MRPKGKLHLLLNIKDSLSGMGTHFSPINYTYCTIMCTVNCVIGNYRRIDVDDY